MFSVSTDQLDRMSEESEQRFIESLGDRLAQVAPDLAETLSSEERYKAARAAYVDARESGFTFQGPIRLWFDMCAALGSGFATDPQYPELAVRLKQSADVEQMRRAQELHAWLCSYLVEVDGPENIHTLTALRRLRDLIKTPTAEVHPELRDELLRLMAEAHPEKVERTGREAVLKLIDGAERVAVDAFGLTERRHIGVATVLSFCFGHAYHRDPLLPWVQRSLADGIVDDGIARGERLERRAIIWLDAVLQKRGLA